MLKAELQNEIPNDTTLESVEHHKSIKSRKRRRKISFDEANLSKEELQKLRREADAQRKKNRRREMTFEEREAFRRRENERKRRDRLDKSYDKQRAKENERKKAKRRAMTTEERQAFLQKDAERKRLERKRRREQALAFKSNLQIASVQTSGPIENKSETTVLKQIKIEYSEDMIKNIKTSHATPAKQKKLSKLRKDSGRRYKPESQQQTDSKSKDIVKMEMSTMMREMMSLDYVSISAEEAEKDILDEKALIVPLSYAIDNASDEDILNKESLVLPMEDAGDHVLSGLFHTNESAGPTLVPASEEESIILPSTEEKPLDPPVVLELIDSIVLFEDIDCLKYDMLSDSSSAECKSDISINQQHVQLDENQDQNLILEFLSNQHEEQILNSLAGNVSIILPDEERKVMPETLRENFIITLLPDQKGDKRHSSLTSSIILNTKEDEIDTTLGKKVTLHITPEEKYASSTKNKSLPIVTDGKCEKLVDQGSHVNVFSTVVNHQKLLETLDIHKNVPLTISNQQKINKDEQLKEHMPLHLANAKISTEHMKRPAVTQDGQELKEKITKRENIQAESKPISIKDDGDTESVNFYILGQCGSKALHSISQVNNETDCLRSNQDLSRRENGWHWAYTALWRKQQRPDYFNVTDLLNNCPIITHETKGNFHPCRAEELHLDAFLAEEYQLQRRYSEPSFEIGNERYVFDGLKNS